MKLLFLILAVVCYAQTYTPVFNENMKYCSFITYERYSQSVPPRYTCNECYDGYELTEGNIYDRYCVESKSPSFPAYLNTGTNKIAYHSLGFYRQDGTCTGSTVKIVDVNGNSVKSDKNKNTPCLACAEYETGSSSKCKTCASGYIMKEGNCVPQSIPFEDTSNDVTNAMCYNGEYEQDKDGYEAKCNLCKENTINTDSRCIKQDLDASPNPGQEDFKIDNCMKVYINNNGVHQCEECIPGYVLVENECQGPYSNLCLKMDENGNCEKCIPGYYADEKSCKKCEINTQSIGIKLEDHCNLFSLNICENCDPNCYINGDKCSSKHCSLISSEGACLRCENGYYFRGQNCVKNDYNNFEDENKINCARGYYIATVEGSSPTEYVCLPCKGNCVTCFNDFVCDEEYEMKVFPSPDPNCIKPNPYDTSICFECKEGSELRAGRCYPYGKDRSNLAGNTIGVCDYYKIPDFISSNEEPNYFYAYIKSSESYYKRSHNKVGENYLCEYHDSIPYYYKYVGGKFSCRGENRDPNNDCECVEGHYSTDALKTLGCIQFTAFTRCEKALNDVICAKCKSPLQLNYFKENDKDKLECGCPEGQRISCTDDNDCTCEACTAECATCRTDSDGNEQCLTCLGNAQADIETMVQNNFNRDPANKCECKEKHHSYDDGEINACYQPPEVCDSDGNFEVNKFGTTCVKCDDTGKNPNSPGEPCSDCLEKYYRQEDSASQDGFKCNSCPTGTAKEKTTTGTNDKTIEYCLRCENDVKCTECVNPALDQDKKCQDCTPTIEGTTHTLIHQYTDASNTEVEPICVKCPQYCGTPTDGDPLCFYSTSKGGTSGKGQYDIDKDNHKNKVIYPSDLSNYNLFCSVCKGDNKDPLDNCECSGQTYNNKGTCENCANAFEEGKEKFCDFTPSQGNSDEKTCPVEPKTGYIKCIRCATGYGARKTESNCTKCSDDNTDYPNEDPDNRGCTPCPPQCATCKLNADNTVECLTCRDQNTFTPNCDVCPKKYYKQPSSGWTLCEKCYSHCGECEENKFKCTKCNVDTQLPLDSSTGVPPFYFFNETFTDSQSITHYGCISCKEGYFDFNLRQCRSPSTSKLIVSSVGVCVKKHASVDGVPDRGDDERGKVTTIEDCSSEDAIGFEWALSCNNEYDPLSGFKYEEYKKGMMDIPVNGECACKQGYIDTRTKSQILGNNKNDDGVTIVEKVEIPLCTDVRVATGVDFCTSAEFSGYEEKDVKIIETELTNKTITPETTSFDEFGTIDVIEKVYLPVKKDGDNGDAENTGDVKKDGDTTGDAEGTKEYDILEKDYIATQTLDSLFTKCNGNCIVTYQIEVEKIYKDLAPTFKCTGCNSDYLELNETTGKCDCKSGYYQTSWGMCVPCNRHISGCVECERNDSIPVDDSVKGHERLQVKCTKCEKGTPTEEGKC